MEEKGTKSAILQQGTGVAATGSGTCFCGEESHQFECFLFLEPEDAARNAVGNSPVDVFQLDLNGDAKRDDGIEVGRDLGAVNRHAEAADVSWRPARRRVQAWPKGADVLPPVERIARCEAFPSGRDGVSSVSRVTSFGPSPGLRGSNAWLSGSR